MCCRERLPKRSKITTKTDVNEIGIISHYNRVIENLSFDNIDHNQERIDDSDTSNHNINYYFDIKASCYMYDMVYLPLNLDIHIDQYYFTPIIKRETMCYVVVTDIYGKMIEKSEINTHIYQEFINTLQQIGCNYLKNITYKYNYTKNVYIWW